MNPVTKYVISTGRILSVHWFAEEDSVAANTTETEDFVEGEYYDDAYYVSDAQPTERPTQSTQLTGLTLTALPANATLHIDDQAYPLDDTTVDLDFPLPGTYRLRVECWPYLDWTGEVTV